MKTINIKPNWEDMCSVIEALLTKGNAEGVVQARAEMRKMARLADAFGKQLMVETFAMNGDTAAQVGEEITHFDVVLRPDGEDPFQEWEDLTWAEVEEVHRTLEEAYPGAVFAETVGG